MEGNSRGVTNLTPRRRTPGHLDSVDSSPSEAFPAASAPMASMTSPETHGSGLKTGISPIRAQPTGTLCTDRETKSYGAEGMAATGATTPLRSFIEPLIVRRFLPRRPTWTSASVAQKRLEPSIGASPLGDAVLRRQHSRAGGGLPRTLQGFLSDPRGFSLLSISPDLVNRSGLCLSKRDPRPGRAALP